VPKLTGDAVAMGVIHKVLTVTGPEAMHCSKQLAQKEGIFVGITAGGTFAAALQVCKEAPRGSAVLCMLPDTGERYLSTPLFADVPTDMTDEELAISRSTPNVRFDVPLPAPPPPATAAAFVDATVREPVVLFALEWCEFCWAVRKMFARYKIPYRSIDLDSVEYQQ